MFYWKRNCGQTVKQDESRCKVVGQQGKAGEKEEQCQHPVWQLPINWQKQVACHCGQPVAVVGVQHVNQVLVIGTFGWLWFYGQTDRNGTNDEQGVEGVAESVIPYDEQAFRYVQQHGWHTHAHCQVDECVTKWRQSIENHSLEVHFSVMGTGKQSSGRNELNLLQNWEMRETIVTNDMVLNNARESQLEVATKIYNSFTWYKLYFW